MALRWSPFRKKKRLAAERAEILKKRDGYQLELYQLRSQRGRVESIRDFLMTRDVHNGFGEELVVAWTPRGR